MIRKEFRQIFRTREMIAIIFIAPILQMVILGFAITNDVKHIKLIIADHDNSSVSRELVDAFRHTERFDIVGYENSPALISEAIQGWQAQMALVIPRNFSRDLQRRLQPDVQIIVDGLDGNTAGVALGYAQRILTGVIQSQLQDPRYRPVLKTAHVVEMQQRMWYNLDLNSPQYMVPGIVIVLLTIISMMLASMSLVREKEIGTLEQLLVTPLRKHQLLLGKLIPFLILAFVELGIVLKAAQFIFSIESQGSLYLLAGLAFFYLFTTLGLGIFISTITNSQQQAMFVSWFFMVFMLLMSGLFIPIENMPDILQKLTYLNPMRYFLYIIRDIFQKGATLRYLLVDAVPMAIFGLLIFTFSVLKFQKRVG
jgi:ABC-2 type transport system permease protein